MSKMIGQNPCEDKVSINHVLYIKKIRINNSKTVSILKMITKYQLPSKTEHFLLSYILREANQSYGKLSIHRLKVPNINLTLQRSFQNTAIFTTALSEFQKLSTNS